MWTEKTVDRDSRQKLYVQMYSIIKEKVEKREWPNGTQIPTEDNICKDLCSTRLKTCLPGEVTSHDEISASVRKEH